MKLLDDIIQWGKTLDPKEIAYGLIVAVVLVILGFWTGAIKKAFAWISYRLALKKYCATLRAECDHLIVVGKRKGFSLPEVYVELDVARSDLMPAKDSKDNRALGSRAISYVLVGGPGAGKSTSIKKIILDTINQGKFFPILLKLREYSGAETLEEYIAHKLEQHGFKKHAERTREILQSRKCLCILDGLDEVRPQNRDKIVSAINQFYHLYFNEKNRIIVTCRKEAYRALPLDIPVILEVRPLSDEQIMLFAAGWPLGYPDQKSKDTFWRDLSATPRILELARSPLLLVGGLMQYTESNVGIPEQRFEYLARVARWLITDWAAAQGHPPDRLRAAYVNILSKLALHLHAKNCAEISRGGAELLVEQWLPTYGIADIKASAVLDSIATRTGVLVSGEKNLIIFAQFGLQEYFASLELVHTYGATGVAKLDPYDWWREVILLAVAQEKEPTGILEVLFEKIPLIAVAAVAECPTPSIALQKKACAHCITLINGGVKEVSSALVPLLRKVTGSLELELCSELEKRLAGSTENAVIVGLSLATAGTELATSTLAKHPEVWEVCLRDAGYLSASVENLLVSWIKRADDLNSQEAAKLIVPRMSGGRLKEILELLPSLSPKKKEYIARLIISQFSNGISRRWLYSGGREYGSLMTRCVSHIQNREGFVQDHWMSALQQQNSEWFDGNKLKNQEGHNVQSFIHAVHSLGFGLLEVSLFIEDQSSVRLTDNRLKRCIVNGTNWVTGRGIMMIRFLAPLALLIIMQDYERMDFILLGIVGFGCWALANAQADFPWQPQFNGNARATRTPSGLGYNILLVLLGLVAGYVFVSLPTPLGRDLGGILVFSAILALLGFNLCSRSSQILEYLTHVDMTGWTDQIKSRSTRAFNIALFLLFLMISLFGYHFFPFEEKLVRKATKIGAALFCVWAIIDIIVLYHSYQLCMAASKRVQAIQFKFASKIIPKKY